MDFNSIFSFEPVSYIGLIVTVNLLYTMTHKPVIYSLNKTQKMFYFLFGLIFYWRGLNKQVFFNILVI
jgi:ATP/ADP translocase